MGIEERSKLVNAVFEHYVASESAKRLKRLGGSMPDLQVVDRSYRTEPPSGSLVAEDSMVYNKNKK